ncbi:MAG: hypothetical protein KJ046_04235 [Anaerolineae bacterium]|nr:hypothetical protein [Anaerolineae bacterium]RIK17943.1 MAG: hypothetical protein DCC51_11790 [Anaerolineae bacterium]
MFNSLEMVAVSQFGFNHDNPLESRRKASLVFERALRRGKARSFWSRIIGGDNHLRDMGRISQVATPRPAQCMGVVNIPLAKIVGSENRVSDFDNTFNPLNEHNRDRWINIALTRRNGASLPPVELIQVGEEYYVRDGHHRISVAKAANQTEIEARIAFVLDI